MDILYSAPKNAVHNMRMQILENKHSPQQDEIRHVP